MNNKILTFKSFYFAIFIASFFCIVSLIYVNACRFSDAAQVASAKVDFSQELSVLSATPQGPVEDIHPFYSVVVVFSEAMVPLESLPEGEGSGPLKIEPELKGQYRWMGSHTLAFIPSHALTLASRFRVTVPAETQSLSGKRLGQPYIFTFETARPKFLHSNIYPDAKGVTVNPKIFLLFNQNISLSDAEKKVALLDQAQNLPVKIKVRMADSNDFNEYVQNYNYEYSSATFSQLSGRLLVVKPVEKLTMLTAYTINIEAELKATDGTLGSTGSSIISFTTYGPLELKRLSAPAAPGQPLKLKFTNRVDNEELQSHITVSPSAEIKYLYDTYWDEEYSTLLYLDLQPRTRYQIRFDRAITDDFGNKLGQDAEFTVETGDYEANAYFQSGEHVIESYLSHDFNVPVLNPKNMNIRLAKLSEKDLIDVLNEGLWKQNIAFNRWVKSRSEKPSVKLNQQSIYPVRLDEVLEKERSGNILIEFRHGEETYVRRAVVQLTDLGITAKFSRTNNLIYVTNLKDGAPAGSAYVEIRGDDGSIVWTGRTDEKGFAQAPGWENFGLKPVNEWSEPRQWVFASKGGQKAYANSDKTIELYRFNIPTAWRARSGDRFSASLFTNQGIYRPGDKVLIKCILRQLQQDRWAVAPKRRTKIAIINPSSEEIFSKEYTANNIGAFDLEYAIDVNAPLGYYSIKVYDGDEELSTESFQVQEFKPVETVVSVHTKKEEYVWGDQLEAVLDGHYLFGAPMSRAGIKWSISRTRYSFIPAGYDNYFFGAFSDEYDSYRWSYATVLSGKTENLDDRGMLNVVLNLKNTASESATLVIEGTVQDKNRLEVSGRKSVIVHAGKYYIGLKPSSTFHASSDKMYVDVIAVDPQGRKLKGHSVKLELIRRAWVTVREKTEDGHFQSRSQMKDTLEAVFPIVTGAEPFRQIIRPLSTGYYIIKATGSDDLGNSIISSSYLYVTGEGYTGWNMRDDDIIDLIPDKKNYNPGETARILVKSPYDKCRALVTVEREGILSHRTVELTGNASYIDIPVTKDLIPNAYVSVILLQGRTALPTADIQEDLGKPAFKIGYTSLTIRSDENKLAVDLKLKKLKFAPGEWVDVDVQVKDPTGKVQNCEMTLYVQDIGVLNLINYKTPDPFSFFYKPRELGVATSETRKYILDQILQANLKDKGGVGGGGEDATFASVAVRKDFKACVYWNPSIMTDPSGNAKVRFQLPDNVTGFKIIAVVHSADSKFGSTDKNITVSKDLMLRPALPRFARVGDELEAGVIVHNYSDQDGTVQLICEAEGVVLNDRPSRDIFLKKNASQEVRYKFNIRDSKTGKFTFKAVMNELTDGVETVIPLRIPTYTETVAFNGSATESLREKIKVPGNIYEDFGGVYVKTASTAMVDLNSSIQYLFEYPYGCLEQKTSRALPVILFGDIVKAFDLEAFPDRSASMEDVIRQYLDDVPKFQHYDGGFGYWIGGDYVSPYVSAYAMFALTQAKAKGFDVNQECFDKGLNYLKNMVRQSAPVDRYGLSYWHTTNAFALATLAENGYYDASSVELLFQRRDELPLYARAMLLKAVHRGKGNRIIAEELRRSLMNAIKMSPTTAHFEEPVQSGLEWAFDSNVRTTSAILQVFLEIDKEDVPWAEKTVKYLLQDRKRGRWRTTQENAYVFWALGSYFQLFEKEIPDLAATIKMDGKQILHAVYKGRTAATHGAQLKFDQLKKDIALPLEFDHSGSGRFYYHVRMTYAPKTGVTIQPRDEGIRINKIFLDESGNKVSNGKFKAGALYKIQLEISSVLDRQFVVVDDPLPAGFEAVNVALATSRSDAKENTGSGARGGWWSYGTFNYSEMRDDRVLVFADWMSKGRHTFTYLVRATSYGKFELPSARAEEMYSPEVFGNTGNQSITVN